MLVYFKTAALNYVQCHKLFHLYWIAGFEYNRCVQKNSKFADKGVKKCTQGRKHIVQLSYPHFCFSGVTLTVGEWPLPPNRLKKPSISAKEQYFSLLGYSVSINESLEQLVTLQYTHNL